MAMAIYSNLVIFTPNIVTVDITMFIHAAVWLYSYYGLYLDIIITIGVKS